MAFRSGEPFLSALAMVGMSFGNLVDVHFFILMAEFALRFQFSIGRRVAPEKSLHRNYKENCMNIISIFEHDVNSLSRVTSSRKVHLDSICPNGVMFGENQQIY